MSEDLFKEIDEELRTEKLHYFMRRYAKLAIVVIIAVLAVFGLLQFNHWQKHKKIVNASNFYMQVMQKTVQLSPQSKDDKMVDQIIGEFNHISNHSPQSIRALAQLKQASLLLDQGKLKEASVIWEALRFDKTASPDFRNLANLLWIENHLDNVDPGELHNRIRELLDHKTPWYALARECEAILDLKTGKVIEAKQVFGRLSTDMNASPELRKRANVMLQVIAANKRV